MGIGLFLYLLIGLFFAGWFVFGGDQDIEADLEHNPVSVYSFATFLIAGWPVILIFSVINYFIQKD